MSTGQTETVTAQQIQALVTWSNKFKACFGKGCAARDVATLTLGTAIAQFISIAATPLLSRLYTPADFGVLAVFLAISGVSATMVTLRYDTAIIVSKSEDQAATIVLLCFALSVAGAIMLGASSWCFSKQFNTALGLENLSVWLPVAFMVGGAGAMMTTVQGWLNRKKNYMQMAVLRVVQNAGVVGLGFIFGLMSSIGNGLLLAQTLAYFFSGIVSLWFMRRAAHLWDWRKINAIARRHQDAPKYLLPTAVLDAVTMQLPVLLIASWFGEMFAGQFSMAWRILMMPMSLVGGAMGQVFMQRFAQVYNNPVDARRLLKKTWLLLLVLGLIPLLVVFLFGEHIYAWVLGETWREAGQMAVIMTPMVLAMFVSSPTSGSYIFLGLQKYGLFFGLLTFMYRPLCLYCGYAAGNFMFGIKLWVVLELFVIFIYQVVAWRCCNARAR